MKRLREAAIVVAAWAVVSPLLGALMLSAVIGAAKGQIERAWRRS